MPGVGESVKRHSWYKKQVPDAIVGGENYRTGQAAANKKGIFLQIVHTQLDKVIAGRESYVGVLSKTEKLIWDSQRRFRRRDALCRKILVKAVHKVCHRLGVELFKGIPVHLSQSEAGMVIVIVMYKEIIKQYLTR